MKDDILDRNLMDFEDEFPLEYAGFWIRLGASFLDFLILIPVYVLNIYNILSVKSTLLMIFLTFIGFLYKPLLESMKSATFGKMALGLKVINENRKSISPSQAWIRYFPWIITSVFSFLDLLLKFQDPMFGDIDGFMEIQLLKSNGTIQLMSTISSFAFLILVGSLAFDQYKQGFHDKAADTFVIKV